MIQLTDYLRLLFADAPRLAPTVDVYVGVLARRRRGGGRGDLVAEGRLVWVDLDVADAGVRLAGFAPAPTLVVASGGLGHRHAL